MSRTTGARVLEAVRDLAEVEIVEGPLARRIWVRPEFDCFDGCAHGSDRCRPGAGGFHGIGARQVTFSVAMAGHGGVTFELHSPLYAESAMRRVGPELVDAWRPLGTLGIHHAGPTGCLEELGWSHDDCTHTGGRCWSDVTFLQAEAAVDALLEGGHRGVWAWLGESWLPQVMAVSA